MLEKMNINIKFLLKITVKYFSQMFSLPRECLISGFIFCTRTLLIDPEILDSLSPSLVYMRLTGDRGRLTMLLFNYAIIWVFSFQHILLSVSVLSWLLLWKYHAQSKIIHPITFSTCLKCKSDDTFCKNGSWDMMYSLARFQPKLWAPGLDKTIVCPRIETEMLNIKDLHW